MLNKEDSSTMLELPMYMQRPSSTRSQDIRHILSTTFREYYTHDAITQETIEKLSKSKGECDDEYHNLYVDSLRKVYKEHEQLMAESDMLECHIMQAQARAMSADERQLNRSVAVCNNYNDLGLPPGQSCFQSCLDHTLLRKHNLIVPSDYMTQSEIEVPPPKPSAVPSYARDTKINMNRIKANIKAKLNHVTFAPSILSDSLLPTYRSEDVAASPRPQEDRGSLDTKTMHHHSWKKQMTEGQRDVERSDLLALERKTNYMRNPRFDDKMLSKTLIKPHRKTAKQTGIVEIPQPEDHEPAVIFLPTPACMIFERYNVGQIYQQTLSLKNVSTVMRSCRLIPPETAHFSVDHGMFPGDHGLVAPGMSCLYTISFSPDSLSDYDDILTVQSQSKDLKIRIQGRRPPPVLTLPPDLHVGYCLVGGRKTVQFLIKNTGGSGKFGVLPLSSWPATNFKSAVSNTNLMVGAFEIRPVVFELLKGESGVIEVTFSPHSVGFFTEQLMLVCDNCHIMEVNLIGEAEKPDVVMEYVEGGVSEPALGDRSAPTTDHHIAFDNLMPFTYTDRMIKVRNNTNVELKYQWYIFKLGGTKGDDLVPNYSKDPRVIDVNSVFGIHPQSGDLHADDVTSFKITFAPPAVGKFNNSLHLVLHEIPQTQQQFLPVVHIIPPSPKNSKEFDAYSEYSSKGVNLHDLTMIEIDLKGQSDPIDVVLKPYAMIIPGTHTIGSTVKRCFSMENYSVGLVKFHWELYDLDHIIEVEPQIGELGANMGMDFELKITGVYPSKLQHDVNCYIENLDTPLCLPVSIEFKGAEISISQPDLNFGLVQLGANVTRRLCLTNLSQFSCIYNIKEFDMLRDASYDGYSKFSLTPNCGELGPLCEQQIEVLFEPLACGVVTSVFEVQVIDGENRHISVFADVQTPLVSLDKCEIEPVDVTLNFPTRHVVTIQNQTLIPTQFHWGQVEGLNVDDVSISIEPKHGSLDARGVIECELSLTALKQADISDLHMPCVVAGMENALYLSIVCEVKGLTVRYQTSTDGCVKSWDEPSVCVDFGENVPIGSNPKSYIHLKNESTIPAFFSLQVTSLDGRPPTPPSDSLLKSKRSCALLRRTPNLADPTSKTSEQAYKERCQLMLRGNHGAAFTPTVTDGTINPLSEIIVEMIAYSDMWGQYTGAVTVKIDTLPAKIIPIKMSVVGTPLTFQALGPNPKTGLIVRMGTHTAGSAIVKRVVRINNTGPCDIRVDWRVYDTSVPQDGLFELITYFGEAFPLKDSKGQDAVPYEDYDPHAVCSIYSEIHATRPKIVHLYTRTRDGVLSHVPFVMEPDQIIVPARGHAIANVWFTPPSPHEITEATKYTGYALGYMSLLSKDKTSGTVTRTDAYKVESLHMDITAEINPALLSLTYSEEEGMTYSCCISDLIGDDKQMEILKVNSFKLSNNTEMPLTFKLTVYEPFLLVENDLWTNENDPTERETERSTLFPRQSVKVKIAFRLSKQILNNMYTTVTNDETDYSQTLATNDNTPKSTSGDVFERRIIVEKEALIEYDNRLVTTFPLKATVFLPCLELSHHAHDFGTCLIGQECKVNIFVKNLSKCESFWTVKIESKSDTCTDRTFRLDPSNGHLEAYKSHISNSNMCVTLTFQAKHEEIYEAVLAFGGMFGEELQRLYITGEGSYDEKHTAHLNA